MTDSNKHAAPTRAALRVVKSTASPTDPQGSYTGLPLDPTALPEQDADDL